ncbi:hypothetical protein C0991_005690 [Blastosporella zonata]|nr:hypothetical protein C0991_005690 [Blastosporella zonata]
MSKFTIEKDLYSVAATAPCNIKAKDDQVTSQIWFHTPALDKNILENIVSVQLETKSHDQGSKPHMGSWSWFDVVVLATPESKEIKVKDGVALVWLSHTNTLGGGKDQAQTGPLFKDIFDGLEVGNALGVRACARFPGWENHASEARLTLRVADKPQEGPRRRPTSLPDRPRKEYLGLVAEQIKSLKDTFDTYLDAATPPESPPAYSLVREMLPTGPLPADQVAVTEQPPLRLLSLDGGGVRGISELYILQDIMARISPNNPNIKPCEYFDMIAGTSTGGLIAIMLGRLKMTIPECITLYTSLASDIFSANFLQRTKNIAMTGAYYTADNFEKGLKQIIKEKTGDENASMLDPDPTNKCKVFVVSGRSQNLSASAEHFRTYATKFPDQFAGVPIWKAARATSAAPTYLPPITINNVEFVDGGMQFNNPSIFLMGEVNAIFGIDDTGFGIARHIECFLSIGTGMQPNISINSQPTNPVGTALYMKSLIAASIKIMTDCERTHNLMQGLFYGKEDVYFRFNAGIKVGDNWAPLIELDDYEGMPKMVSLTKAYLVGQTVQIGECANALSISNSVKKN